MDFKEFRDKQQVHIRAMLNETLFTTEVDKDEMWNTYLDSFPPGTNEIFRQRREFDCSCCRNFIKNFGNVVMVKDGKLVSIWAFETNDTTYQPMLDVMDEFVTRHPINGVFASKVSIIGTEFNHEEIDGRIKKWHHFLVKLPGRFISRDIGSFTNEHNTNRDVLERSLRLIYTEAVESVLDLISQNSLYRGEEWQAILKKFLLLKKELKSR